MLHTVRSAMASNLVALVVPVPLLHWQCENYIIACHSGIESILKNIRNNNMRIHETMGLYSLSGKMSYR